MYDHFTNDAGSNITTLSRPAIVVMDRALTYVEGLVARQGGGGRSPELEARVDVLCSQVYIIARILLALIEARSGCNTSIELLNTRTLSATRGALTRDPRDGWTIRGPREALKTDE